MDRPTHELTTSSGHTLILNDYITGGEKRQITEIYLRALGPDKSTVNPTVTYEAENFALTHAVVSLDGSTDNLIDRLLALPVTDYDEVVAEVKTITDGKKKSVTPS